MKAGAAVPLARGLAVVLDGARLQVGIEARFFTTPAALPDYSGCTGFGVSVASG